MQNPSGKRWRAVIARRRQVRRRRALAVALVVPLVIAAVWAAYAWPTRAPALVPSTNAVSQFDQAPTNPQRLVIARLENIPLLLPVPLGATTAIAFQPVDQEHTVAFAPAGGQARLSAASSTSSGNAWNGGLHYYTMGGDGTDVSAPTAGLDVGAVPGAAVYAPVDGQVVAVTTYKLLGRYPDTEIDLQLAQDSSVILMITHIENAQVSIGDSVIAGVTTLGSVRGFPPQLDQPLRQFTTDNGDHVQLVAVRVPVQLSGP